MQFQTLKGIECEKRSSSGMNAPQPFTSSLRSWTLLAQASVSPSVQWVERGAQSLGQKALGPQQWYVDLWFCRDPGPEPAHSLSSPCLSLQYCPSVWKRSATSPPSTRACSSPSATRTATICPSSAMGASATAGASSPTAPRSPTPEAASAVTAVVSSGHCAKDCQRRRKDQEG